MRQLELYNKAPEEEQANIETDPIKIFHQAIENTKPLMGLSSIKRGGKSYQVSTLCSMYGDRCVKIFHQAIENTKPLMGLSSIKRGGKSYQVSTLCSTYGDRCVKIFHQAIENTKPLMGLSSIKRGGKSYQVSKSIVDGNDKSY